MLADTKIDLTEENKFAGKRSSNILGMFPTLFPWNIHPIDEIRGHCERLYGDCLSDEIGCTVRRDWDNKLHFADVTMTEKPWFTSMLAELLSEIGLQNDCMNHCPRCGKLLFSKNIYCTCPQCNLDQHAQRVYDKLFPRKTQTTYIPWLDYGTVPHLVNNEWKTQITETPPQILLNIRN